MARPVFLRFGPFTARLRTSIARLTELWQFLYPAQLTTEPPDFVDFDVGLEQPFGPRRWWRPLVRFTIDGETLFHPLPREQAGSICEWGLNACVSSRAHQYLIFHAAAVERAGRVAILPGAPQSGKSTLTAALVHRGWRLLSDELTMVRFDDGRVVPLCRPIHLKNRSIDVIRDFAPEAAIAPPVHGTLKGTVALVRAPAQSVGRMHEAAPPRWIVFPRWREGGTTEFAPVKRPGAFLELARNGINYSIHGRRGFNATADLVEGCDCLSIRYTDLDAAVAAFDRLAAGGDAAAH
jgi:HprK-related kinase A